MRGPDPLVYGPTSTGTDVPPLMPAIASRSKQEPDQRSAQTSSLGAPSIVGIVLASIVVCALLISAAIAIIRNFRSRGVAHMRFFKRFDNTESARGLLRSSPGYGADTERGKGSTPSLITDATRSSSPSMSTRKVGPRGLSIDTSIFPSFMNPSWRPGNSKSRGAEEASYSPLMDTLLEKEHEEGLTSSERFALLKSAALPPHPVAEPVEPALQSGGQPDVIYFSMTTPLTSGLDPSKSEEPAGLREALASLAKLNIASAMSPTSPYSAAIPSSVGPYSSHPTGSSGSVFSFPPTSSFPLPPNAEPVPPLPVSAYAKHDLFKRRAMEGEDNRRDLRPRNAFADSRGRSAHASRSQPHTGPTRRERSKSKSRKKSLRVRRAPVARLQHQVRPLPPIRIQQTESRRAVHFAGPRALKSQMPKPRPVLMKPLTESPTSSFSLEPQPPEDNPYNSPPLQSSSSSLSGSTSSVSSPPQLSFSSSSISSPSESSAPNTPSALTSAFRMSVLSSAHPTFASEVATLPPGILSFEEFASLPGISAFSTRESAVQKLPPTPPEFATTAPLRLSASKLQVPSGRSTPPMFGPRSRSGSVSSTNSDLQLGLRGPRAMPRTHSRESSLSRSSLVSQAAPVQRTSDRVSLRDASRAEPSGQQIQGPRGGLYEVNAQRAPATVSPPADWVPAPYVAARSDTSVAAEIMFPGKGREPKRRVVSGPRASLRDSQFTAPR
ncbi:hypothetical protein HGRIS_001706 [Hohenbuehelia grisea]|uniref:Proteophosphoglycan ppg4 n=1 Tax=Hohenbuehelia grisea TaxID=104357 RepID=A0ABR3JJY8_9AGAR